MRLRKVEISNFRAIKKAEIELSEYSCFVGQNGAGKSTFLNALNVFFRQTDNTGTDLVFLNKEDFHNQNTDDPIVIKVHFSDLSEEAKEVFSHYARGDSLIITAKAEFDPVGQSAEVKHYGARLAMAEFATFFEEEAAGAKVAALNPIYEELQRKFGVPSATSKQAKMDALREFETAHPELCVEIPSADQFYGVSRGANKLERFVQWVYVPAVKDAVQEQSEQKNSALGKLLARAVRAKTNFEDRIAEIKAKAQSDYQTLLEEHKPALKGISQSLNASMAKWAHEGVELELNWEEDKEKSIRVEQPSAAVRVSEGFFKGQLARLGHGIQRSYLIALLQELALFELTDAPKLILAIEEPELYQHPPQARHLADVLASLASENSQVVICTHSPYFVSGSLFEHVFVVKKQQDSGECHIFSASADRVAERIGQALNKPYQPPNATRARLQQILQPQLSELFFAPKVIFVEGREDIAYIKSYLQLNGLWDYLRRYGCHFVAADKKSELLRPLIVAQELQIDSFTIFDADGQEENAGRRAQHDRDNKSLMTALGLPAELDAFPNQNLHDDRFTIWQTCLGDEVKASVEIEAWEKARNKAAEVFEFGSAMSKNIMFIAELMRQLDSDHVKPKPLSDLTKRLQAFAES